MTIEDGFTALRCLMEDLEEHTAAPDWVKEYVVPNALYLVQELEKAVQTEQKSVIGVLKAAENLALALEVFEDEKDTVSQ